MSLYRDVGIVLRTYKLGEADRIVVIMTRSHGKVRAVAKGVRRTRSKFGSRLEPGSHIDVQLYEGRGELDIVTQAESVEHYRRTRDDLSRMSRASSLLEAVDQVAQDREPTPRLFQMLLGGLRTVDETNPAMISAAFYLKLLALEGVAPELDMCVGCGSLEGQFGLALEAGGIRCESCGGGRRVSPEALAVGRAVLGGGLNTALTLPEGSLTHELEGLATMALEAHIERRLRAVRLLSES